MESLVKSVRDRFFEFREVLALGREVQFDDSYDAIVVFVARRQEILIQGCGYFNLSPSFQKYRKQSFFHLYDLQIKLNSHRPANQI